MKTTKLLPALSLALIFFAATGFAKEPNSSKTTGPSVNVRYVVTVNLGLDKPICNTYQVELVDANGRAVAPAQYFVPGNSAYTFYEQTRQAVGIRKARLVLAPNLDRYACQQELYTPPDVKVITFKDRETYSFILNPNTKPAQGKEQ